MENSYKAFIDPDLALDGADSGALKDRTFAVKDLFDVAGHVTGCGNPTWAETHDAATAHAPVVERLLAAGANIRGKSHTDELAFSLNGENHHYGTPVNANAPGRIPGGSSNGSAAAVAGCQVDFALGTDTGGSVRVPGSYCGIFGLRPTHDRIPLHGLMPLAPSFDTIGWFARDPVLMRDVGHVLFDSWAEPSTADEILFPEDLWDLADAETVAALMPAVDRLAADIGPLKRIRVADGSGGQIADWFMPFRVAQGWEIWKSHGDWITAHHPTFGPGIAERFQWTATISDADRDAAEETRSTIRAHLKTLLGPRTLMVLPTAPGPAPIAGQSADQLEAFRYRGLQLTSTSGLTGVPQINLPVARAQDCPVGLSVMAAHGGDEMLLELAVRLCSEARDGVAGLRAVSS